VQVVVRSLNVLKALAHSTRGLNLAEVSARLEMPVASAHRILAVLESEGFVTRSSTNRRYFLGPASRELGRSSEARQSPLVTAHQAVTDASRATGETVFISELSGNEVVCIALCESTYPLRLFVRVGQVMPLHAAASARVLLAWRDAEEARRALTQQRLVGYTDDTPTSIDEVFRHLQLVRARGFDICESELDENVWAVSAPVRASTDDVVASVTLAAPQQRISTEQERNRAIELIVATASAMSADLGWSGPRAVTR
jgi:DNA-binding IclR family transcriptional regulator